MCRLQGTIDSSVRCKKYLSIFSSLEKTNFYGWFLLLNTAISSFGENEGFGSWLDDLWFLLMIYCKSTLNPRYFSCYNSAGFCLMFKPPNPFCVLILSCLFIILFIFVSCVYLITRFPSSIPGTDEKLDQRESYCTSQICTVSHSC